MSVRKIIEFDTPGEHTFPAATLEISGDQGRLKSLVPASEIMFANYDDDADPVSKRGDKTVVFGGTDNTGSISGGLLTFDVATRSTATYANITDIVDDFAIRFQSNALNPTVNATPTDIAVLRSNVDSSAIEWSYANGGSGITRVYCKVIDSVGSIISDFILALTTHTLGMQHNIALSNDDDGNLTMWLNGALVNTIASPSFDFTDCDLIFGENSASGARASFDNVQLFNSNAITTAFAFPFPEATEYSIVEQTMITPLSQTMCEISAFVVVSEIPTGTSLKHYLILNSDQYYHNGSAWVESNGTLAQANTAEEINTNLASLPIVQGIGKIVQVAHVFLSTAGYDRALLEQLDITYCYAFKSDDLALCTVYGDFLDEAGQAVVGGRVWILGNDKVKDNAFIGPNAFTLSTAQGKWSISVPETETENLGVDFVFEYSQQRPDGETPKSEYTKKTYAGKIIPNLAAQKFELLNNLPS